MYNNKKSSIFFYGVNNMVNKKFFMIMLFCLTGFSVCALQYIDIEAGLIYIGNGEERGAPGPIVPTGGVAYMFAPGNGGFYFLPRLLLYAANYNYEGVRPLPAEPENTEFLVLGGLFDFVLGMRFVINKTVELGTGAGVAVLLRLPISLSESVADDADEYSNYFYGNLRFIYPDVDLFLKWNVSESFSLSFTLKGFIPVFHLWDGEELAFWDQLYLSLLIGICLDI
jgi:hypothetical protein